VKIIQILPELNSGGVERGTCELAEHLVKTGHDSIVISHGGRLTQRLAEQGTRHITLPIHRKSLASFFLISTLRKIFLTEKPEIIHVRSRVPAWLAWLAWKSLPRSARPHFVTTYHGFYSVNSYSRIMTCGEKIIAVSESVKQHILKNYPVDSERITVIHRGISNDFYRPDYQPSNEWLERWKEQYPQVQGKYHINLPGRISRWKGHEHFCHMIHSLIEKNLPVHGTIAGSCHPKKQEFGTELRSLIATLKLDDHITFLGDRTDLREVMSVSDAVVSLSLDPEAFGRVSLEAMGLGKPVAAYHHGGVAEQLDALFPAGNIPPGNWQAAATLIASWIVQAPQPPLENSFTLEKMLFQTMKLYTNLISNDKSATSEHS
jgi:glycosyltransferase involved in cell wall biosynthesis